MPAAYWCDHPECTGRHGHGTPVPERCPAATERKNARESERQRELRRNDPAWRALVNSQKRAYMHAYSRSPRGREVTRRFDASAKGLARDIRAKISKRRKELAGEF